MSAITSHVLDTSRGCPAEGVPISLSFQDSVSQEWNLLGKGTTNSDGRVTDLFPVDELNAGNYKIKFDTKTYFQSKNTTAFYPYAEVVFTVDEDQVNTHFHIPLLLSNFSYSTYRGS